MTISNKFGWMVLTTGNKSEMATGYATLYGDMAGGYAVIKDVPKTLVYALCRDRNARAGRDLIPTSVLEKPPSAELAPDQFDSDSLPPYDILDPIIEGYVEDDLSVDALIDRGHDPDLVRRVARMIDRNEYKRRQAPPGVRVSPKAFGKDRRPPITNRWPG
jgi:NAD+ synthase (glutamine-hydrolysing)